MAVRALAWALCGLLAACADPGAAGVTPTDEWDAQRRRMVEEQLRGRDITDGRVLAAMLKVPRHAFVPKRARSLAYGDHPLPIGRGQTISQPYVVALMTQLLELKGSEKVLEVGTGSGYQAAVLAELARSVYSIEIEPQLAASAGQLLQDLGYSNVHVRAGDGFYGWPEEAPFDAVIITAAAPRVPERLVAQLREGGRIVMPLGEQRAQRLVAGVKREGRLEQRVIGDVLFVPMTGAIAGPPQPSPSVPLSDPQGTPAP